MPPSKSNSTGSEPGQGPAAIAIDAELAGRLVAALELIGTAIAADDAPGARLGTGGDGRRPGGPVDPVRVRVARDYNVLRGLLGRADAPQPLRMHRVKTGGGPKSVSDNAVVVDDKLPASARYAVVESLGDGNSGLEREPFEVDGNSTPTLALTDIPSTMPISRVEIFDHNHTLVAFGPSAAAIA
jgi:hypothetical protein